MGKHLTILSRADGNVTIRVNAVISKVGEVTQKDFGKILGLTIQDALEDHNKDNDEIGKDVWKVIKGYVNREAAAVVRESFVQAL